MAYNLKEMTEMCSKWVAENGLMEHGGARLKDFCAHFGIDSQTYYRWLENADFADAIKKGKNEFKEKLEQRLVESLSKAACGYEFEETKTEYEGKKVKKKIVTVKNVEANVGAAIFPDSDYYDFLVYRLQIYLQIVGVINKLEPM
jgi:hypothetical protein